MVGRVRHVITMIYDPLKLRSPLPHPVPQLRRGLAKKKLLSDFIVDCHMDYTVACWVNAFLQWLSGTY